MELFNKISDPKELTRFDNYILKYFNEEIKGKLQNENDKIYLSLKLERAIKDYLTEYKE